MKKHTSFKIGGPADFFITIDNIEKLKSVQNLAQKENIPFLILGNGSNVLVLDKGIRGIVAKLKFDKIKILEKERKVIVSADFPVSKLSRKCAKRELSGIEFLCGIPGTIGGAVRMNAGAYGSEIKDVLLKTKYLDETGKIKEFTNKEQNFGYRTSIFKDKKYVILEVELQLTKSTEKEITEKMDEMMKSRIEKQPIEYPSAGSTFKRKENMITAKLIDECNLKGISIGDAAISEKHAGFVINKGNATANDVLKLVQLIKNEVYQRFNQEIELEVLVIGEE